MASDDAMDASLSDKIEKMQQKVKLIEGELRANEDSARSTIAQNREAIADLRQRNKELRRELVRFHAAHHRIVSGNMAVPMLREESMSKAKLMNAAVYATQLRRQHLHDLRMQDLTLKPGRCQAEEHGRRIREDELARRGLDNSLVKARLRFQDAERISEGYFRIKQELQLEGYSFQNQLDCLDASILEEREELCNLRAANSEARCSTEAAEEELRQLEDRLSREREERERVLGRCRSQAQESKAQAEGATQTAIRSHRKFQVRGAFRHLRAVTHISNAQETVERFVAQGETREHLKRTKAENDDVLRALRDKTPPLDLVLSELKYSMVKKRAKEERILATPLNKLRDAGNRQFRAKSNLEKLFGTLGSIGLIVERIAKKLIHITLDTEEEDDDEDEDEDDDDDDYETEEATEDDEAAKEDQAKVAETETPPVQEDKAQAPPSTGNYWTDRQSTFQTMVSLLGECAAKLLQLQDENLAAEVLRRRGARRKARRARLPDWKAPKRQSSATMEHIKRLKELERKRR